MIKFNYPNGDHCYRVLHTVHAIYHDTNGKLMARAERSDRTGMHEFEIVSFELVPTAVECT